MPQTKVKNNLCETISCEEFGLDLLVNLVVKYSTTTLLLENIYFLGYNEGIPPRAYGGLWLHLQISYVHMTCL